MQPLKASIDCLPLRFSMYQRRAKDIFPRSVIELNDKHCELLQSWHGLDTNIRNLEKELGSKSWPLILQQVCCKANKLLAMPLTVDTVQNLEKCFDILNLANSANLMPFGLDEQRRLLENRWLKVKCAEPLTVPLISKRASTSSATTQMSSVFSSPKSHHSSSSSTSIYIPFSHGQNVRHKPSLTIDTTIIFADQSPQFSYDYERGDDATFHKPTEKIEAMAIFNGEEFSTKRISKGIEKVEIKRPSEKAEEINIKRYPEKIEQDESRKLFRKVEIIEAQKHSERNNENETSHFFEKVEEPKVVTPKRYRLKLLSVSTSKSPSAPLSEITNSNEQVAADKKALRRGPVTPIVEPRETRWSRSLESEAKPLNYSKNIAEGYPAIATARLHPSRIPVPISRPLSRTSSGASSRASSRVSSCASCYAPSSNFLNTFAIKSQPSGQPTLSKLPKPIDQTSSRQYSQSQVSTSSFCNEPILPSSFQSFIPVRSPCLSSTHVSSASRLSSDLVYYDDHLNSITEILHTPTKFAPNKSNYDTSPTLHCHASLNTPSKVLKSNVTFQEPKPRLKAVVPTQQTTSSIVEPESLHEGSQAPGKSRYRTKRPLSITMAGNGSEMSHLKSPCRSPSPPLVGRYGLKLRLTTRA